MYFMTMEISILRKGKNNNTIHIQPSQILELYGFNSSLHFSKQHYHVELKLTEIRVTGHVSTGGISKPENTHIK